MEIKFINNKANIEGLTFKQLALIESLVNEASRSGGYQIDIDDYEEIMKGFRPLNIKEIFDLEGEKHQIEDTIRKIMQIDKFRELFSMVNQCKDNTIKTYRLAALMTEMENYFNIPILKDEEFNKQNPDIMNLYLEISNARKF